MRVGCAGCLTALVFVGLVGTSAWGVARAFQKPAIAAVPTTAEDAAQAQQKLYRLIHGGGRDPVVMTEAEVNAFVLRNVDRRDLPLDEPIVRLREGDVIELAGRVTLGRLFAESPLPLLTHLLPDRWRARSLWLRLTTHATVEHRPRSQLRLDVLRLSVGMQRLPTVALRLLFEPASLRFVRVALPDTVGDVRIEDGRAVIRRTSSRERT